MSEGTGIPQDEQHQIVDWFADMANSDRASNGDLGLSIYKAIFENLGGEIGCEIGKGNGTKIYFSLPKTLPYIIALDSTRDRLTA